ncbi:hypothetical protein NC651_023321 [Populus alba x Populus x berolinensis]|nr:hypothetical protein NC651_023321 [Populus alba x Populus x berolinensis]
MDCRLMEYAWLTTHNSSAMGDLSATWSIILAPTNQQDTVTSQLNNGIRGLTLDMYDFQNDIWLSHSFGENCYNIAAFCCGKRWPNFIAVDFYKSVHFTLSFPNMTFGACNLTYLSTYCRFKLCKPTGGIFLLVADLNSVPVFFGCTNYRKDMPF